MVLSIGHDLSILSNFIVHTPFAIYALLAVLLIFIACFISIYLDEFYLKLLLPVTYLALFGFGIFYYWDKISEVMGLVSRDFSFHNGVIGMMPYLIGFGAFLFFTFGSIFLKRISTFSKVIHITAFTCLQFLFFCFIYTLGFVEPSFSTIHVMYQNDMIVAVLNVSVWIVIVWLGALLISTFSRMIYQIANEEEVIDVPIATWNDVEFDLKQNLSKLEVEIAQLKKQSERDRTMILERFDAIEDSLGKTNEYFLSQIQEVMEHVENDHSLVYMEELQNLIEENYNIITSELQTLKGRPETEMKQLKEKLEQLEKRVYDTNGRIVQQLELLKVTPEYEIEKMKDEMNSLELLLQRYMHDINHELVQTKKEFEVSKKKKHRRSYEMIK